MIEQYFLSRLLSETLTILVSCVSCWFWLPRFGLSSIGSLFPLLLNSILVSPPSLSSSVLLLLCLNDGGLLPRGPLTRVLLIFCRVSSLSCSSSADLQSQQLLLPLCVSDRSPPPCPSEDVCLLIELYDTLSS